MTVGFGRYVRTAEFRAKAAGQRRGRPGHPQSEEVRAKIRAAHLGKSRYVPRGEGAPNFKHGKRGTPTYNSWQSMLQRCTNPNATSYPHYGARGIKVCAEWVFFDNFLADMGVRPIGTTLDRVDADGNYEPGNCRWATSLEQRHNQRQGNDGFLGHTHTLEVRSKISARGIGRRHSPGVRAKISASRKAWCAEHDCQRSFETREKIGNAQLGIPCPQRGRRHQKETLK